MTNCYFFLESVQDWPHDGVSIQKGRHAHKNETWSVENIIGHFSEFSYENFFNISKFELVEPDAYKFIVNFIHMPTDVEFACSEESINYLNSDPRCFLVLFSCHEYVITPESLSKYIISQKIPCDKVIVVCSNLEAHKQTINGIKYICINFWESFTKFHHRLLPNVPIGDPKKLQNNINKAEKKFLCFNRNIKPHRIWFYYALIKSDMLNEGYVSYHLPKINPKEYSSVSNSHWTLKRIPAELHNDFKQTNARKMYPRMLDKLDTKAIINYGSGPRQYYDNSLLSIVTESDSVKNFITEKTYKAIANLHPFFIVGNPDQHALLRQRGYHTFEELFNSNSVINYAEAMTMLGYIKSQDIKQLKKIIRQKYIDKLIHNQKNFFSRKIYWTEIVNEIVNATKK